MTAIAGWFIVAMLGQPANATQAVECSEWTECRQLALDAAARKDYETFHDMAWRAVQLGPKNDPALLLILARAQSLSGRPHDALVMLRRLAPTGVARDAAVSDDFGRVRGLREWPEVEALLTAAPDTADAPRADAAAPGAAPPARVARYEAPAVPAGAEVLTFAPASFAPAALAYDAVSRRFIISDADVSRLAVIDEFSHQVATLASGHSAGFSTITAVAIDPREGDLWVASVDGSSGADLPSLHKLQLISGRALKKFASESKATGRFVDIAVAGDGTVYAVQEPGRVWQVAPTGGGLELTSVMTHSRFTSVTVATQGVLYIVGGDGVLRFTASDSAYVTAPDGVDLRGLAVIRWSRGSLIALQRIDDSTYRAIRARLSRDGRSVTKVDVLDAAVAAPNPVATLAGDTFYYLAAANGPELAIRKVVVR